MILACKATVPVPSNLQRTNLASVGSPNLKCERPRVRTTVRALSFFFFLRFFCLVYLFIYTPICHYFCYCPLVFPHLGTIGADRYNLYLLIEQDFTANEWSLALCSLNCSMENRRESKDCSWQAVYTGMMLLPAYS